jgi:hypothetical protein
LTPSEADEGTDFVVDSGTLYFCGSSFGTGDPGYAGPPHEGTCADLGATDFIREVPVDIVDDNVREIVERFQVILSTPPSGGSDNVSFRPGEDRGTISIEDDDYEIVSFDDISVNEDGSTTLTVEIEPSVPATDSVDFTISHTLGTAEDGDVDYSQSADTTLAISGSSSGTITISANAASNPNFVINDDFLVEFAEDFTVTITPDLTNVAFTGGLDSDNDGDADATVTINIDEKYHFRIDDSTALETDGTMLFDVSLVPDPVPASQTIQVEHDDIWLEYQTIPGTGSDGATNPEDYVDGTAHPIDFTGLVMQIAVTLDNDDDAEDPAEYFTVQLTDSNYMDIVEFDDDTAQGEIRDSDYIITPTWNELGDVSLVSGGSSLSVTTGTAVVITDTALSTFTVDAQYRIHSVVIDGIVVTNGGIDTGDVPLDGIGNAYVTPVGGGTTWSYTFGTNIPIGSHSIDILFDHQVTMQVTGSGNGSITHQTPNPTADPTDDLAGASVSSGGADKSIIADHGQDETFRIDSTTGCLLGLYLDGNNVGGFAAGSNNWSGDDYTIGNVSSDHTLMAEFGSATITVNIAASDAGDDIDIQDPSSGSGWRAYVTDSTFNPVGPVIKTGKHGDTFTLPDDAPSPSCDSRFILIQFLDVDGWLKPEDIQLDLQYDFHDKTETGIYDSDKRILNFV